MSKPTVAADGSIIMPKVGIAHPDVPKVEGSFIEASAKAVENNVETQTDAMKALGGPISGGRRKKYWGGAAVEVKNVPSMVSAGGTDAKAGFAELLRTANKADADAAYDKLGAAPPKTVDPDKMAMAKGGRRRRNKTSKKGNGRTKRAGVRKHRRSRRGSRRIRRSRH